MTEQQPSIVVLISGSGSNLQAIIDATLNGDIKGKIVAVISNRAEAYGLERARKANIPTRVLDHREFEDRESFDAALGDLIEGFKPSLIILAGFMRILTEDFVRRFEGRMLNIHPSLLPKYRGLNTHQRAIEAGDQNSVVLLARQRRCQLASLGVRHHVVVAAVADDDRDTDTLELGGGIGEREVVASPRQSLFEQSGAAGPQPAADQEQLPLGSRKLCHQSIGDR